MKHPQEGVGPLPYGCKKPKPNEYSATCVLFGIDTVTVAKLLSSDWCESWSAESVSYSLYKRLCSYLFER